MKFKLWIYRILGSIVRFAIIGGVLLLLLGIINLIFGTKLGITSRGNYGSVLAIYEVKDVLILVGVLFGLSIYYFLQDEIKTNDETRELFLVLMRDAYLKLFTIIFLIVFVVTPSFSLTEIFWDKLIFSAFITAIVINFVLITLGVFDKKLSMPINLLLANFKKPNFSITKNDSLEKKLTELKELNNRGVITDEEYQKKRQELIEEF